jgi:uncharacterized cupin superfamily protein
MREAELVETESGLVAEGEGWFVLNPRDAAWQTIAGGGSWLAFEAEGVPNQIGAGLHRLPKGESTGLYHRESNQEGFMVLEGECLLVVEGQERTLRRHDYFHCPPNTGHILLGASEEPCVLFVFGNRLVGVHPRYPVDATAARHGVSVAEETDDARVAYGPRTFTSVPAPWPAD